MNLKEGDVQLMEILNYIEQRYVMNIIKMVFAQMVITVNIVMGIFINIYRKLELLYHPMIYKTKMCSHVSRGGTCPYTYCCFAHRSDELRGQLKFIERSGSSDELESPDEYNNSSSSPVFYYILGKKCHTSKNTYYSSNNSTTTTIGITACNTDFSKSYSFKTIT